MKKFAALFAILALSVTAAAGSIDGAYRGTVIAQNGDQGVMTLDISESPVGGQPLAELAISSGPSVVVVSLAPFSYDPTAGTLAGSGSTFYQGRQVTVSLSCSGAGSDRLVCTTVGGGGSVGHAQLNRE
jgi:hypothetical protein